jgi:rod shape-determining protein MreD
MKEINKNRLKEKLYGLFPSILLILSVLNEFDFNSLGLKYFSFNFSYILIFYYSLKKKESLGYILVFVAGLFNDVVVGMPIGISSLIYLLLCGAAAYLRNITLRPSLFKDWIFFLITILILKSIVFILLTFIFEYEINYLDEFINVIFTFLLYLIFSYLFNFFEKIMLGMYYAR